MQRQPQHPSVPRARDAVLDYLARAAIFAVLWWALTGGKMDAWPLGAAIVVLAATVSMRLRTAGHRRFSLVGLLGFVSFFLVRSFLAGVQVAQMALRPRLNLCPAILEIPLRLQAESDRILLAGTISLLPGSLSAGLAGNRLVVHVLDRRMPVERDIRLAEERVARIFVGGLQ